MLTFQLIMEKLSSILNHSPWRWLKILLSVYFFYLSVEYYVFWIFIAILVITYLISDHLTTKVLNDYRELMDENNKTIFDTMSRREQIRSLSGDIQIYDHDSVYIRDTIAGWCDTIYSWII